MQDFQQPFHIFDVNNFNSTIEGINGGYSIQGLNMGYDKDDICPNVREIECTCGNIGDEDYE